MKFYGKAQETAEKIIDAFRQGNIPEPLATVFITRQLGEVPMANWSWLNQFVCIISFCSDARGFRQWEEVGRKIIKGEKARARILVPLTTVKEQENEAGQKEKVARLYGFKGVPVFDISQTTGDPLNLTDDAAAEKQFLEGLPLMPVAKHLGLTVSTFSGKKGEAYGWYHPNKEMIALGVENVATWLHEFIHAADKRAGNLKEAGQHWRSETVAQLGAATLATILGLEGEADLGFTWKYIEGYAQAAEIQPITACTRVLERTCQAIDLILTTAQQLTAVEDVHLAV